jgi:hypothetical protein
MLPTNKPSSLIFDKEENRLLPLQKEPVFMEHQDLVENQNIYITSDEEIKVGGWVLGDFPDKPIGKVISKYGEEFTAKSLNGDKYGLAQYDSKKIILTTDQNLIKDGVQAIDDEFLDWFIKNPSCESVEVNKGNYELSPVEKMLEKEFVPKGTFDKYKIIIPKEEPKLETLEEAAERTEFERYGETLTNYTKQRPAYNLGFKNGTKWQQEQITIATDDAYSEGFENGKQYQAERSYSEEDMKKAFRGFTSGKSFKEWFEQFKKK